MPVSLTVSPTTVDLLVGEQLQLNVGPNPNGVKWSCTACNVASVNSQGLITALAAGEATITARRGNVTVGVTVVVTAVDPPPTPEPQPPTVNLVAAYGSTEEDTWGFSTAGTAAAEGDTIVDATIDFGEGAGEQTLPLPLASIIEHNWLTDGNFPVTLAIETALGQYGETTILALVQPGPTPPDPPDPLQSPIPFLTFVSGQFTHAPVTLSTLGTYDPDGDELVSYTIDWDDGTIATVPLASTAALPTQLQHTYLAPGVYTPRFTVRDDDGSEGSTALDVSIVDQPTANIPPIARLVQQSGAFAGDAFTFSTVGSTDPDGVLTQWLFQNGAGEVQGPFAGPPPATISSFAYPIAGSYAASLTVKDNDGAETTAQLTVTVAAVPSPPGDYAYFNAVTAMPQRYVSRTLRSQDQLIKGNGQTAAPWVTYDPVMDAAKIVVPPFEPTAQTTLAVGINSSTQVISFSPTIVIQNGRPYKIDNEVVVANRTAPGVFEYIRGQYGTTPAAHLAGTSVFRGCSSLISHVNVPISAQPNNTYFYGWELRHDAAMQDKSHKTWNHTLAPDELIYYEINHNKPSLSNGLGARGYGTAGPNLTDLNPMAPVVGAFTIAVDRWTRIWTFIDQRPAIPLFSLWAGDAVQGVVQLLNSRQMTYRGTRTVIDWWIIEYNTSTTASDALLRNLVGWNRNFFVLRGLEINQVPLSVEGLAA